MDIALVTSRQIAINKRNSRSRGSFEGFCFILFDNDNTRD